MCFLVHPFSFRHLFAKTKISFFTGSSVFTLVFCLIFGIAKQASATANEDNKRNELTLKKAIQIAQEQDEWLVKSKLTQQRFESLSRGANVLPDPSINLSLLNLPGDSFNINQEPITQVKIGASQLFPKGETLALTEEKFQSIAAEQPYLREDRLNVIALQSTHLWLNAYEAKASYRLVEETRPLFIKLSEIVSASYAASVGNARQQDILRAELELMRLKDRLVQLKTKERTALADLTEFLLPNQSKFAETAAITHFALPEKLPMSDGNEAGMINILKQNSIQTLYQWVLQHPLLLNMDKRIASASLDVEIAQQAYKPQYGLNASYAYRTDDPTGRSRADLYSVGLSISVPLFSGRKIDSDVQSSRLKIESMQTEKRLLAKEMMAKLQQAYERFLGASERYEIYSQRILPQMSQQADAAINAYTNDTGDFAEVVRAKIAELDAKITLLNIDLTKRRALARMHYYLPTANSHKVSTHE